MFEVTPLWVKVAVSSARDLIAGRVGSVEGIEAEVQGVRDDSEGIYGRSPSVRVGRFS